MSDRIRMLAEGRIGGSVLEGSEITQEALLAAAMRPSQAAAQPEDHDH